MKSLSSPGAARTPGSTGLRAGPFGALGLPVLVASVSLLALSGTQRETLAASWTSGNDADGDGLSDLQEEILGTDATLADSDLDGLSDLEEVARGSDPEDAYSLPGLEPQSIGVFAREANGIVTLGSAVYVANGSLPSIRFEMGVVIGGVKLALPSGSYFSTGCLSVEAGQSPGSKIVVLETPIPSSIVQQRGSLAIYSLLDDPINPGNPIEAGVLNLVDFNGVTMVVEPPYDGGDSPGGGGTSWGGGGGLIYTPLTGSAGLPASFTSGEICWQATTPVGLNGPSVVQEIDAASCEPTESSCSPVDCGASVGTTIEVVDPTLLIGG